MTTRRVIFIILIAALMVSAFATTDTQVKRITAYKQDYTQGYVPDKQVNIRFLTEASDEFDYGETIYLDDDARGATTGHVAFSWILSGNAFGEVSVAFTFYPMANIENTSMVIPYTIWMNHDRSRIGNAAIICNADAAVTVGGTYFFPSGTDADYEGSIMGVAYADCTYYTASAGSTTTGQFQVTSSNTSGVTKTIKYDMSQKSKVVDQNRNASTTTLFKNTFGGVCEFWNRYGIAYINLNIDKDNPHTVNNLDSGLYRAQVHVEVTAQ